MGAGTERVDDMGDTIEDGCEIAILYKNYCTWTVQVHHFPGVGCSVSPSREILFIM